MIRWLLSLFTPSEDAGLRIEAGKFGTKAIRPEWTHYDEAAAIAAAQRARKRSATGRTLKKPATRKSDRVVQITERRRA